MVREAEQEAEASLSTTITLDGASLVCQVSVTLGTLNQAGPQHSPRRQDHHTPISVNSIDTKTS